MADMLLMLDRAWKTITTHDGTTNAKVDSSRHQEPGASDLRTARSPGKTYDRETGSGQFTSRPKEHGSYKDFRRGHIIYSLHRTTCPN